MEKFTWTAYNVYTVKVGFKTFRTPFESGASQRRAKWTYPKRAFVLRFEMSDWETEAEEILNFFIARRGAFEEFEWDNPDEDDKTYRVTFAEDFLNLARFSYKLYTLGEVMLVEERY